MTTLRQQLANEENAKKSTGPRTKRGKERSRKNALKHGLAGEGIVLPDEEREAVEEREGQWNSSLRPFNAWEVWLVRRIATESIRIERCAWHDEEIRIFRAHRAVDCWDEDRRAAVEELAARMGRRPGRITRMLAQSTQGCDWLIERWESLGQILEAQGTWDEPRRALALDLLGVPRDLRDVSTPLDVPADTDPKEHLAKIARDEVARLSGLQDSILDRLDEAEREAAMRGVATKTDPELSLIRRYESSCARRMKWAYERLRGRTNDPIPPMPPPGQGDRPDHHGNGPTVRPEISEKFKRLFPNYYGPPSAGPEPKADAPVLGVFVPGSSGLARSFAASQGPIANRRARRAAARRARSA